MDAEIRAALSAKFSNFVPIHEGSSAYSYKATHTQLNRTVFLKVTDFEATEEERSLREPRTLVEAVQSVGSENIVQLYDADVLEVGGNKYVCMQAEFVNGQSLYKKLSSGPIGQGEALLVACGILQGLIGLHAKDLVHRDLKPANVMLDSDGRPKVADLGSVARVGTGGLMHSASRHSALYTPPEAFLSNEFSKATDIYQVGMLLHEMANGSLVSDAHHWLLGNRRALIADMDPCERAVAEKQGICERARNRSLLEHGSPTLPVTSTRLRRLIRQATSPDPTKRGAAIDLRIRLLRLSIPNWLADGDTYVAKEWKGFDYRVSPTKNGWLAGRRNVGAEAFRKCTNSSRFDTAQAAASWVEMDS